MRPVLLVLLLNACLGTEVYVTPEDTLGLEDAEVQLILDFLNDCDTTFEVLDNDVPLDSDTAESLISHRNGVDGLCESGDDDLFDSLTEVDEVPNVGVSSIRQIWLYLSTDPAPDDGSGTWDDVDFTAEEAAAVLEMANQATKEELTAGVGLTDYRADIIIDNRSYEDMDAFADTSGIGEQTLLDLKDYIPQWQADHPA